MTMIYAQIDRDTARQRDTYKWIHMCIYLYVCVSIYMCLAVSLLLTAATHGAIHSDKYGQIHTHFHRQTDRQRDTYIDIHLLTTLTHVKSR